MNSLALLSYNSQVRRLRELAGQALRCYALGSDAKIHFINHGENTTFRVETKKGRKFLLRIHREDYHSKEGIHEELAWLARLGKVKEITVPVPVPSKKNLLLVRVATKAIPEGRFCALLKWTDGSFIWKSATPRHLFDLGELIGRIQKHSRGQKSNHRRYWHAEGLVGKNPKFGSIDNLPDLSKADQRILTRERKSVLTKLRTYERRFPGRQGLIHADMHFGNFLVGKNGLGAIDFDDCGFGFHVYDLAIPLTHLKHLCETKPQLDYGEFVIALQEGYASVARWDEHDEKILPLMLKARALLMLGWLNSRSDNPKLRKHLKGAVARVLEQIRKQESPKA